MSTLLLDVGNTRLKWCTLSLPNAPLAAVQAIAHQGAADMVIAELASQWQASRPEAICIASVMGAEPDRSLADACQQAFGCAPRFARSRAESAGLKSAYAEAERLGVDRWLAMLALWTRQQQAFCVASAGTALTFDAVDASGQHQGGVIAPGLAAMIEATLGRTRFAVTTMQNEFDNGLGKQPETAVRQGALHAAAGLLDRLGARYQGTHTLAGGDAETLLPELTAHWQLEADLVLKGLAAWSRLSAAP